MWTVLYCRVNWNIDVKTNVTWIHIHQFFLKLDWTDDACVKGPLGFDHTWRFNACPMGGPCLVAQWRTGVGSSPRQQSYIRQLRRSRRKDTAPAPNVTFVHLHECHIASSVRACSHYIPKNTDWTAGTGMHAKPVKQGPAPGTDKNVCEWGLKGRVHVRVCYIVMDDLDAKGIILFNMVFSTKQCSN